MTTSKVVAYTVFQLFVEALALIAILELLGANVVAELGSSDFLNLGLTLSKISPNIEADLRFALVAGFLLVFVWLANDSRESLRPSQRKGP